MGSGPRFAAWLAEGMRANPGVISFLSLSDRADVLSGANPPPCDITVPTYGSIPGFACRAAMGPLMVASLVPRLKAMAPDLAVCAHPGPLDLIMGIALRIAGVPFVPIVHDADAHPGDGLPLVMPLQRVLCRMATGVVSLTGHVGDRLVEQGVVGDPPDRLIRLFMPPLGFASPPPRPPGGPVRFLFLGRLLPYKGLDLLNEALDCLGPRDDMVLRVVGSGPESGELNRLAARPGVTVENRWVPEEEFGEVLAWSDALVLPYREASQSGVAAAALAAGRAILATDVGGLREQIGNRPGAALCLPEPQAVAAGMAHFIADPEARRGVQVDAPAAWRNFAARLLEGASALPGMRGATAPPAEKAHPG